MADCINIVKYKVNFIGGEKFSVKQTSAYNAGLQITLQILLTFIILQYAFFILLYARIQKKRGEGGGARGRKGKNGCLASARAL